MDSSREIPQDDASVDRTIRESALETIERLRDKPDLSVTQDAMLELIHTNLFQQMKQFNSDCFCNRFCSLILSKLRVNRFKPGEQFLIRILG